MRLKELSDKEQKTLMSNEWDLPSSVSKWLTSKGLKFLGSGAYSGAYGKPGSDKIVKVNRDTDEAYMKFIHYIKQHPSVYFPKIYDYKALKSNGLFLFITERLERIPKDYVPNEKDGLFFAWILSNDFYGFWGDHYEIWNLVDSLIKNQYAGFDRMEALEALAKEFSQTPKGRIVTNIQSLGNLDVHTGNVMIRPNGEVVLNDPVN